MAGKRPSVELITSVVVGAAIATGLRFLWDLYQYTRPQQEERDDIVDGVPGLIGEKFFFCNVLP